MISISLSIFRGFPARKCLIYIVAQILGAFCAVWIAYGIYADAIMSYDPQKTSKSNGTGTAFFTLPGPFVKPTTAFFTDFTSAAVLYVIFLSTSMHSTFQSYNNTVVSRI